MTTFRRSLNVNIKSTLGKMRININVKEIQRDTKCTQKKYSHVESRQKFGANDSLSEYLTQGSIPLMNSISQIRQLNFDQHFFRTENCLLARSVF